MGDIDRATVARMLEALRYCYARLRYRDNVAGTDERGWKLAEEVIEEASGLPADHLPFVKRCVMCDEPLLKAEDKVCSRCIADSAIAQAKMSKREFYCHYCHTTSTTPHPEGKGSLCESVEVTGRVKADDKCGTCGEWPPCACAGATEVE